MSISLCDVKKLSSESVLCNNKEASQLFACDTAFLGFNFGQNFLHMVDVLDALCLGHPPGPKGYNTLHQLAFV